MSLAFLEGLVVLIPSEKNMVDVAFCVCARGRATFDNHILVKAANSIFWEEKLNTMMSLKIIATTNDVVARVDVNSFGDSNRHDCDLIWFDLALCLVLVLGGD